MISIILPVYNNEKTLKDVLNSLIININRKDELIIINDASTDSSNQIIKSFIKKYNKYNIKLLINKKRSGISKSLNKGIGKATKKYIARIDGDDINISNRFEYQLNILKKNKQIDLLSCAKIDYKNIEDINYSNKLIDKNSNYEIKRISKYQLAYKNLIVHPSVIYKAEIIKNFKYNQKYCGKCEDYFLWLKLISAGVNIYSCSTPVIYYFNKCLNIKKVKLQNIYSIKARISFLDIRNPLFSLFLLIGSIIDMMRLAKIQVSKNNEI